MKKCIFYLPYELLEHGTGARMMRPKKMIEAFEKIGYNVFVIQGYSGERRKLIRKLKESIKRGEKYDFMYTESSTEPTLLTNPNHLPTHPFLDFGFFKYIKKQGIKIGLFYCDIYWKFDTYGQELSTPKRLVALKNYEYDIQKYKQLLDKFYVPDLKMLDYLKSQKLRSIAEILPPGAENIEVTVKSSSDRDFSKNPLQIFYVGGIGNHYQIAVLVEAVSKTKNCILTLCCRDTEWNNEKHNYEKWLNDRIHIIHKNGDELEPYYQETDICSLVFKSDKYREMAMPYKAFEYLGHEKPVIATKGTAIGRFTEQNQNGWVVSYDENEICDLLNRIISDPTLLAEKNRKCIDAKKENLWICRAQKVVNDLKQ
ncbi:glycosyltransferase [Ruminococcus sp. FC2018]|uniref:glycosyltransferase n=1 Tax=Ruminococcus sp. FC2018 TaxID=1410617 RepID=UPI000490CC42|nr:glycosyltransferase [Ruminococcus sp. FC2018]